MKRRLVFEDKELLSQILGDLKFFRPSLEALKAAYEGLEIGAFTDEILDELVLEGTAKIFERHTKGLNDQLDKTGVVNGKLREIVLQGTEGPRAKVVEALTDLKAITPKPPESKFKEARTKVLPLQLISFDGERFFVNESDEEWLMEAYCRDYLETETTQSLYARLEIMRDALNDFRTLMTKVGLPIDKQFITSGLDSFLSLSNGEVFIKPRSVNGNIQGMISLMASRKAKADRDQQKRLLEQDKLNRIHAHFDEQEKLHSRQSIIS